MTTSEKGILFGVGGPLTIILVAVALKVWTHLIWFSPDEVNQRFEPELQALSSALELYHSHHGGYPRDLKLLLEDGEMKRIPHFRMHFGRQDPELFYKVTEDGMTCLVSLRCLIDEAFVSSVPMTIYYDSFQKRWRRTQYPPDLIDIIKFRDAHASGRN